MIRHIGTWLQKKIDGTSSLVKAFFIGALDGLMTWWMIFGAAFWFLLVLAKYFAKDTEESDD